MVYSRLFLHFPPSDSRSVGCGDRPYLTDSGVSSSCSPCLPSEALFVPPLSCSESLASGQTLGEAWSKTDPESVTFVAFRQDLSY